MQCGHFTLEGFRAILYLGLQISEKWGRVDGSVVMVGAAHVFWRLSVQGLLPAPGASHAHPWRLQTTPLVAGLTVAAAAFVGKQAVQTYIKFSSGSLFRSSKSFYRVSHDTLWQVACMLGCDLCYGTPCRTLSHALFGPSLLALPRVAFSQR